MLYREPDPVQTAIDLFEKGLVDSAARKLRDARNKASVDKDQERLQEIERVAGGMSARLEGAHRARFIEIFYRDRAEEPEIDVSPIGLAIAIAGAVGLVIASFLPYAESTTFARVAQNTLIEHGDGWILIVLAVVELFALYRIYVSKRRNLGPIITGVIAVGFAIYWGTDKSNLRLCPLGSNPLDIGCETAKAGIGIYVAGVAGLLMIVGGWQLYRPSPRRVPIDSEAEDSKTCPDCAESVKSAARVCRYCGHQFEAPPDVAAPA